MVLILLPVLWGFQMSFEEVKLTAQFIDLVNSTLNAEHLSQSEYVKNILLPFQETAKKVEKIVGDDRLNCFVRGDEVFLYFFDKKVFDKELTFKLIDYFILLRTIWHLEKHNVERIKSSKSPIDIGGGLNNGISIHLGNGKVEGYTINKTKRIEGLSREGTHLRILVSHSVKILLEKVNDKIIIFSEKLNGLGKGLADELEGYEVKEYYSESLFNKIREYYSENIDDTLKIWEELSNQLHLLSTKHYWFTNLYICYLYYRFTTKKDFGLLKIAESMANKHYFLDGYFMPDFIKASLKFHNKCFEQAFYLFHKCSKRLSSNKVKVPRLLCALELLKTKFPFDNGMIRDLRNDFLTLEKLSLGDEIGTIFKEGKKLLFD